MTNVNTSASAVSANEAAATPTAAPKIEAFYSPKTPEYTGPKVSLWITEKTHERSPVIDGTIGETRVAGFLQQGPKSKFLNIIDSKAGKDANGHYTKVATARLICGNAGIANLAITMEGSTDTVWSNSSRKVPHDFLIQLGLDEADQATKKAAYDVRIAAKEAEAPAAA